MKIIQNNSIINYILSFFNTTFRKTDIIWILSLYGTAIGTGVLFLPINIGIGGIISLIITSIIAFPITFFSHRNLCRFILSSNNPSKDITIVTEEYFGNFIGKLITLLYFFAIYSILLVYSVAITNTVNSFIEHQLNIIKPPRCILSLFLIISLMTIIQLGEKIIIKIISILVFPFIIILMILSFYMIPYWNSEIFKNLSIVNLNNIINNKILINLWLIIPIIVFSFNHSPIISSFTMSKHQEYGKNTEKKCSYILICSHIMMVFTVMFFVFSCILSLSLENLIEAKIQNISILSYLANHFNDPFIEYISPIIAFIAITKSFFGHYLGVRESLQGLIIKFIKNYKKDINLIILNRSINIFILISTWFISTINPSILGLIKNLGSPIIAIILFLMPIYAIYTIPNMKKYNKDISNFFILIIGLITISSIFFNVII
ncbi:Serine transporter [Serratia symbiotica]|nr:Serine transporter [Serratia symbiotica]